MCPEYIGVYQLRASNKSPSQERAATANKSSILACDFILYIKYVHRPTETFINTVKDL
jgi:hypothetical protein